MPKESPAPELPQGHSPLLEIVKNSFQFLNHRETWDQRLDDELARLDKEINQQLQTDWNLSTIEPLYEYMRNTQELVQLREVDRRTIKAIIGIGYQLNNPEIVDPSILQIRLAVGTTGLIKVDSRAVIMNHIDPTFDVVKGLMHVGSQLYQNLHHSEPPHT